MLTELFEQRRSDAASHGQELEKRGGVEVIVDAWRANAAAAGGSITPFSAMQISAVWAAILLLSDTLASLPLITYERNGRAKTRAPKHNLYPVLHDQANEIMTAFEFRELMEASILSWGNAYAQIFYDNRGRVTALWPLLPGRMIDVKVENGRKLFHYQPEKGAALWMTDNEIWHIPGMGSNGITGYSPIAMFRRTIGLAKSAEDFGARFFENDARPGIVLEHPGKLGDQAFDNLRTSWAESHQGVENSHKPAILEEGMKLHEIGIPPEDAQFLETRKFQVTEIARIFRVPPHMIGDLDKATFSNIEQQSLDFVIHSVRPWLTRWEQSIWQHLMLPSDRERYFAEFLVDGMLRGDTVSRYTAYATGRQNGWLSANDIRELENMNPVEGGDVYLVPLNMIPADQVGDLGGSTKGTSTEGAGTAGSASRSAGPEGGISWASLNTEQREMRSRRSAATRHRLQRSYQRVLLDVSGRIMRREVHDIKDAANRWMKNRDLVDFLRWLKDFYQDHKAYIERQMKPVLQAYGELVATEAADEVGGETHDDDLNRFMDAYTRTYAGRHAGNHEKRLYELIQKVQKEEDADLFQAILDELDLMEANLPADIAGEESVRANNAAAKLIYGLNAIAKLRWVSFGNNCPYCSDLDGMVVAIEQVFIGQGDGFQPDGADTPLNPGRDIGHPPAHKGCDCMITAG
jgi:HK97 family phage portal protein